jgi:transcription elongation GreA/GreB family factor
METIEQKKAYKKKLYEYCLHTQNQRVNTAQEAITSAQESAKEEDPGSEEKFESFRTQMQQDQDMFSKQLNDAQIGLNTLRKIEMERDYDMVMLGAIVVTDTMSYFISINIGQVKLEEKTCFAISIESPLFRAMVGKKKGEVFNFRDKNHKILDIY